MAKQMQVAAAAEAIQRGQAQVISDQLSTLWDQAQAEVPAAAPAPVDPNAPAALTQADVDKAVADAKAADAQAVSDAQAAVADLQAKLDDMTAKESADESVIASLQSGITAAEQALSALVPKAGA
jgi:hypothetical protein